MKAGRLGAATERFHLPSAGLLHQGVRYSEAAVIRYNISTEHHRRISYSFTFQYLQL